MAVTVKIQCCHVGYVYSSTTGECVYTQNRNNDIILGLERISNKYIYICVRNYVHTNVLNDTRGCTVVKYGYEVVLFMYSRIPTGTCPLIC